MTSTEIPLANASAIVAPAMSQPMVTMNAMVITAGTKIPDTLSAMRAIGAFVAAASDTKAIIFDNVVSSPTLVALALI